MAKNKYQIFNFGHDDGKVQIWKAYEKDGVTYELNHLNAHEVDYTSKEGDKYRVYVTYSHHCFAKDDPSMENQKGWLYAYDKDPRPFHVRRYELSKNLPSVIEGLMSAHTFHAGGDSYAVCPAKLGDGQEVFYQVAFVVYRSNRKLRMHVKSAYPLDKRPKVKKVGLSNILKALLKGKPLPKRQA
jgi:hypothetical protein